MASAYDQEALKATPQAMESLVSFDAPAHFKKMTGGTSQGWVTMGSIAKGSDVKSFTTQELAGAPGLDAQDNPFYHPAINRNATITSNPLSAGEFDNRGT